MKLPPGLLMAWRNLWRHRRRTWLTASAMVFANALLIFGICLQTGTYQMMIDNGLRLLTGHVQVQAQGYLDEPRMRTTVQQILPLAQQLRAALALPAAARAQGFALLSSEQRSFGVQVLGVEPAQEQHISFLPAQIKQGDYLATQARQQVVLGSVAARNLKVGVGDEITLLGSGLDGSFAAAVLTVSGIFETGLNELDRSLAQIHLADFQSAFSMQGAGHQIVLRTTALAQVPTLKAAVSQQLAHRPELVALDWDQLQPELRQAIAADMASSWFMYGVLILLVAFSVMNTQLMAVLERTREFGVMLALGLKPARLSLLVMFETGLLALLGLVLGVLLGGSLAAWLSHTGFTFPGMEDYAAQFNMDARIYPRLTFWSVMTGPLVIFIASLLASLYPALRLLGLKPLDAMRSAT